MTAPTDNHPPEGLLDAPSTSAPLAVPFTIGSLITIAGSVLFIVTNGTEPREAFLHWSTIPAAIALVTGCLILAFSLAHWRPDVPAWATLGGAAGVALAAASAYGLISTGRAVAQGTDNSTFKDLIFENTTILIPLFVKSAILFASLLTIGIAGLRRKTLSKPSAIAFIIAAIASLIPVAQPGLIVLSVALLLTTRHTRMQLSP